LIEGGETEDKEDDVWQITGSASGTTIDGNEYTKVISDDDPLIAPRDCLWIVSGTVTTTSGDVTVVIDFGDGECDNLATRTEGDVTEEFEMKCKMKKFRRFGGMKR
jgi:hypothetical protein